MWINEICEDDSQHHCLLIVWVEILPQRLTGKEYCNFLKETQPDFLEDVPMATRITMWFMQDDTLPHFSLIIRDFLTAIYGHRWIG